MLLKASHSNYQSFDRISIKHADFVLYFQLDMSNPESVLKLSKKGKTLMTFVNVDPSFSRAKTEEITKLWQTSLWNSHIQAER